MLILTTGAFDYISMVIFLMDLMKVNTFMELPQNSQKTIDSKKERQFTIIRGGSKSIISKKGGEFIFKILG